ncbi:MAG: methyltransferase domain-containing protein [Tepidisphaeraceae bacterium]
MDLRRRNLVAEQMDADDVDPRQLADALRYIRRINKLLRYNAAVIRRVELLASATEPITLLDVATGSGDLLAQLGPRYRTVGLDRHTLTIREAKQSVSRAIFIRGDALALPFADNSFDIVTSNLFLHHLPGPIVVAALREMARVAQRGIVVADLLRNRRAYAWITLFTLTASPIVKHDARASVAHAFTLDEARNLFDQAGLASAKLEVTFGHRFVATWKKP